MTIANPVRRAHRAFALMRSCFVTGCGRSGTSLAAGLLAQAGYFMGDELYAPDEGNPRGYFEDREVNAINEGLLATLIPGPHRSFADRLRGRTTPNPGWFRWLATLTPDQKISCVEKLRERIRRRTSTAPFCFKDPRFCYTLGVWRAFASEAAALCVFRDPTVVASSIVAEAARDRILIDGAVVNPEMAARVWLMAYRYVLEVHLPSGGDWLFIHYDQLMDGSRDQQIEELLGVSVNRAFADRTLRRSRPTGARAPALTETYRRLCELAEFHQLG